MEPVDGFEPVHPSLTNIILSNLPHTSAKGRNQIRI
jgi:hypothetical protein